MIQPDFNLFLWVLFILYGLGGIGQILAGATGYKKELVSGNTDIIAGLIKIAIIIIVLVR